MSFVSKVKASLKKQAADRSEQSQIANRDFTENPLLYIALIMSALLSTLSGVAIGLGVQVTDGVVTAKVYLPNIVAALLYGASFPIFFEYGLNNWLKKFMLREPENSKQLYISGAMVIITFVGTCVTVFSASDVIATAFGFFNSFTEIPAGVQKWIVYALPTMFMINVAAGEGYRQFSQEAELRRVSEMSLREAQVDADLEVRLAQMNAKKNIALHAASAYSARAEAEAPSIGANRGEEKWNQDYAKTHAMTDPAPAMTGHGQPTPPVIPGYYGQGFPAQPAMTGHGQPVPVPGASMTGNGNGHTSNPT